jgi:hypothetical protein
MAEQPIKAIQTRYAGCHFRSRLEARWAVFWDSLDWPWEYEPQGFDLPHGPYLPDFSVTPYPERSQGPVWFEVKPPGASDDMRWPELAVMTGIMIITAKGMHRRGDNCSVEHTAEVFTPEGHRAGVDLWAHVGGQHWDAASSARFEHGERPAQHRTRRRGRGKR